MVLPVSAHDWSHSGTVAKWFRSSVLKCIWKQSYWLNCRGDLIIFEWIFGCLFWETDQIQQPIFVDTKYPVGDYQLCVCICHNLRQRLCRAGRERILSRKEHFPLLINNINNNLSLTTYLFDQGYNVATWSVILLQSFGGICVSLVMKVRFSWTPYLMLDKQFV